MSDVIAFPVLLAKNDILSLLGSMRLVNASGAERGRAFGAQPIGPPGTGFGVISIPKQTVSCRSRFVSGSRIQTVRQRVSLIENGNQSGVGRASFGFS